jgi:hypothetical protein
VELDLLLAVVEAHRLRQAGRHAGQLDLPQLLPVRLEQPHPPLAERQHVEPAVPAVERQQRLDVETVPTTTSSRR